MRKRLLSAGFFALLVVLSAVLAGCGSQASSGNARVQRSLIPMCRGRMRRRRLMQSLPIDSSRRSMPLIRCFRKKMAVHHHP